MERQLFRLGDVCRYPNELHSMIARMAALLTLLTFMPGCRSSHHVPDPKRIADFGRTTALTVRVRDNTIELTDSSTIQRMLDIYRDAKWQRYWHTLPANKDDRSIVLHDGDTELCTFGYNGVLWESSSYDDNRTAELTDADRDWVESLFAQISDSETANGG